MKREYSKETIDRKVPDNSQEGFHWETVEIQTTDAGTTKSSFEGEWEICRLCGYIAPRTEMGEIDGKWYCFKYDCYEEVIDRLKKEM